MASNTNHTQTTNIYSFILGGPTFSLLCHPNNSSSRFSVTMRPVESPASQGGAKWRIEIPGGSAFAVLGSNQCSPMLTNMEVKLILTCPIMEFPEVMESSKGRRKRRIHHSSLNAAMISVHCDDIIAPLEKWKGSGSPVLAYQAAQREAKEIRSFWQGSHSHTITLTTQELAMDVMEIETDSKTEHRAMRKFLAEVLITWSTPIQNKLYVTHLSEGERDFKSLLDALDALDESARNGQSWDEERQTLCAGYAKSGLRKTKLEMTLLSTLGDQGKGKEKAVIVLD